MELETGLETLHYGMRALDGIVQEAERGRQFKSMGELSSRRCPHEVPSRYIPCTDLGRRRCRNVNPDAHRALLLRQEPPVVIVFNDEPKQDMVWDQVLDISLRTYPCRCVKQLPRCTGVVADQPLTGNCNSSPTGPYTLPLHCARPSFSSLFQLSGRCTAVIRMNG